MEREMNDIFTIAAVMFYAVLMIALLDYIIFMPRLKYEILESVRIYNETGVINVPWYTWIPACMLESLFFIAGLTIGYGILK
jgi:hypothetical protein